MIKDPRHIIIPARDVAPAYAQAAARLHPGQPSILCGITGANGKTSTACFLQQLFTLSGFKAASLGTMGVQGMPIPTQLSERLAQTTSVEAGCLHKVLDHLTQKGCQAIAMECSSHGLALHRLDAVRFSTVGFTNLSPEHLDFHDTMEKYFAAKSRLFLEKTTTTKARVIFRGTPWGDRLAERCAEKNLDTIAVGRPGDAVWFTRHQANHTHMQVTCHMMGKSATTPESRDISLALLGHFQLENLGVAIAMARAEGLSTDSIFTALPHIQAVPGRLELVQPLMPLPLPFPLPLPLPVPLPCPLAKTQDICDDNAQKSNPKESSTKPSCTTALTGIVIDFAHTPDALEKTLLTLKALSPRVLRVVFGCGGNRDKTKRPIMGAIAHRLADHVIVTDDNPRNERPDVIRQEILNACPTAQNIGSRAAAIATALHDHAEGDILLIAGKGTENYQIYGDVIQPFSDIACVHAFFAQHAPPSADTSQHHPTRLGERK